MTRIIHGLIEKCKNKVLIHVMYISKFHDCFFLTKFLLFYSLLCVFDFLLRIRELRRVHVPFSSGNWLWLHFEFRLYLVTSEWTTIKSNWTQHGPYVRNIIRYTAKKGFRISSDVQCNRTLNLMFYSQARRFKRL